MQSDSAGNALSTAKSLNITSNTQTYRDHVGFNDNDYYHFNLSSRSSFNLTLNGMSRNADVRLIDGQGNIVQGSHHRGTTAESIKRTLDAGSYFMQIYSTSGVKTKYKLNLAAKSITPADNAGNSTNYARNIGNLSGTHAFSDFVGTADTNDYYRFSISNSSNISLTINGMTSNADLRLLDKYGKTVHGSYHTGTTAEAISRKLDAGIYYVQINPAVRVNTNYSLSLSATPVSNSFNNSFGYGLTDAAAAVAKAIGENSSLANVPNRGGNDWGLDMINAPEVWARGYTGKGIVVAVVDTGVDFRHTDLDANIWRNMREIAGNGIDDDRNGYVDDTRGWNFINQNNNVIDLNGHGTHVAGTIAAENNGLGVTGVAYNSQVMPVKVLDDKGAGSGASVSAGIRYAVNNGANIINLSLGGGYSSVIEAAIQYATERGVAVIMAAGNQAASQPDHPARFATKWGIAVGAVNSSNQMASFSNRAGNTVMDYVVAPGVNIYSTTPNNTYQFSSGTSMATPHVAGVAALMLSANRSLTPTQLESILTATANSTKITATIG